MGETLSFYLSLGLFSSFGVDSGTRMLLKTIAQHDIIPDKGSILDAGCGTGVIAVSLKKRFPNLDITAADRDALALKFTKMNARLNKLPAEGFSTSSGLLPGSLKLPVEGKPSRYNMIISNIPAKAGNPVIKDFLQNCGLHLISGGKAAVVIVAPLADFAREALLSAGAEITFEESDKQYSVFHFIPQPRKKFSTLSDIYERTGGTISGFYGLPDFDSISYRTRVILDMLGSYGSTGKTLIWNPGTGHVPAACGNSKELYLAGTDLMQLKASGFNLTFDTRQLHLPVFSSLSDAGIAELDYIIASPELIHGAEVEKEVTGCSAVLLRKKGKLLVAGKSSDIAKFEKNRAGYTIKHSIKYRGFRALLLEKQ